MINRPQIQKKENLRILVTGAAGFIGYHTIRALIAAGHRVIGVDNLNSYYSVELKEARLRSLQSENSDRFVFFKADICDQKKIFELAQVYDFNIIVHLAAQAGVRYGLENPDAYIQSNVQGFLNVLEVCRSNPVSHLVFASSSSVYGLNSSMPFSEEDRVDQPASLYAATKRANELMAHSYAHLFGIPCTGLRFFTVYGPWGRPDMAIFQFAESILNGKPITLFDQGKLERDFTYIDDIVDGITRICFKPPRLAAVSANDTASEGPLVPYQVFNIGNHKPVMVLDVLRFIEEFLQKKAEIVFASAPAGDVRTTFASVTKLASSAGFSPKTPIDVGLAAFLEWLLQFRSESQLNEKRDYQ